MPTFHIVEGFWILKNVVRRYSRKPTGRLQKQAERQQRKPKTF